MALTLTYNPDLSRVQIEADGLGDRGYVTVERSFNNLIWTTVRGGLNVPVVSGSASLDDYEFLSDRVNYYRVTPHDVAEGFEGDVTGWEAVGGTLAYSTEQAHTGVGSAKLTPDGVTEIIRARTTLANSPPVTAGEEHEMVTWAYVVTGRAVDISVEYLDETNTTIQFFIWETVTLSPDVWTRISGTGTAPTGAVKARLNVNIRDMPDAVEVLYIDDVEFNGVTMSGEVQTASITPSLNDTVWLKSIQYPFLNRPIEVVNWSDVTRVARNGVFPISGRSVPVGVTDLRLSQQFTLDIITRTFEAQRDMDLILATGSPMFIHVPYTPLTSECREFTTNSHVPGGYVVIGDTVDARRSATALHKERFFTLPCTVVAAPEADVIGTTMTWGAVLNLYGSWEQLIASNPTWPPLLEDISTPDDMVVL